MVHNVICDPICFGIADPIESSLVHLSMRPRGAAGFMGFGLGSASMTTFIPCLCRRKRVTLLLDEHGSTFLPVIRPHRANGHFVTVIAIPRQAAKWRSIG